MILNDRPLILVLSAEKNKDKRDAIHETWAHDASQLGIKIFYVIGCHPGEQLRSGIESEDGKAIFRVPVEESISSLSEKMAYAYRWVHGYHLFNEDYVFKCDDDTYVDPQKLVEFIRVLDKSTNNYVGKPLDHLPHVASGGAGYLLSRRSIAAIACANHNDCHGKEEDVNISRILRKNGIYLTPYSYFDPAHYGKNRIIPSRSNLQITTHYVSPDMMRQIWNKNTLPSES